jgi:RHS repeat-associated protein
MLASNTAQSVCRNCATNEDCGISELSTRTKYTYDGDGNRVAKSGGASELYWQGAGSDALAESDASGNITNEYVFFGGKRVARVDSAGVHYYISDHLGSATVIANASGAIEREEMYFPYGGERWNYGSDPNHYKFTGKERDTETGLDYFGARYYGSNMGRWMSPDWAASPEPVPYVDLSDPQTLNEYGYVRNNPLSKADPDGHEIPIAPNDIDVERSTNIAVGAAKGLWNMVAGTWNTGAELLNAQGQSSGQTYMEVPTLPTASYDNPTQAVSGSLTQLATVVASAVKGLTGSTTSEAGAAGKAAGSEAGETGAATGKGLGNPFKGKSASEVDSMMKGKGMDPRGPDPAAGKGGYVNPKTGRSYHIDENNRFGEKPHVDVNRSKTYKGDLDKKKYPM